MKKKGKEKRFVSDVEWMRRVALGALAFFLILYGGWIVWFNASRAPANIFDELANCAVDYASGDPLSPYCRKVFGGAWANPFRSCDIARIRGTDENERDAPFTTESKYEPLESFYRIGRLGDYLSCIEYTTRKLADPTFSDGSEKWSLSYLSMYVSDETGTCWFLAEICKYDMNEELQICAQYDRSQKVFTSVQNYGAERAANPEEREAALAGLHEVFLPLYFEAAGPSSAFSMDDLGEWGYGEDVR